MVLRGRTGPGGGGVREELLREAGVLLGLQLLLLLQTAAAWALLAAAPKQAAQRSAPAWGILPPQTISTCSTRTDACMRYQPAHQAQRTCLGTMPPTPASNMLDAFTQP